MTMARPHAQLFFALGLSALLLQGCNKGEDSDEVPEKPKVAFDGKPDDRFVGYWSSADNKAHYDLKADGVFDYNGKVSTPGGVIDNKFSAKWCVKGDDLLFTDRDSNVTPYIFVLEGDNLKLTSKGSLKLVTKLVRKKK